jgi:hypothetical protein
LNKLRNNRNINNYLGCLQFCNNPIKILFLTAIIKIAVLQLRLYKIGQKNATNNVLKTQFLQRTSFRM